MEEAHQSDCVDVDLGWKSLKTGWEEFLNGIELVFEIDPQGV